MYPNHFFKINTVNTLSLEIAFCKYYTHAVLNFCGYQHLHTVKNLVPQQASEQRQNVNDKNITVHCKCNCKISQQASDSSALESFCCVWTEDKGVKNSGVLDAELPSLHTHVTTDQFHGL